METIVARVNAWNAARYPQQLSYDLQRSLMHEEVHELLSTDVPVDVLDAACDIAFVAIGGLWKANAKVLELDDVTGTMAGCLDSCNFFSPAAMAAAVLQDHNTAENENELVMASCAAIAFSKLIVRDLGVDWYKAMMIVCDSNDSKSISKTDPSVKANVIKGNFFVAPEPRLQALMDARTQ